MGKIHTFLKTLKTNRKLLPKLVVDNLQRKQMLNWMSDKAFLKLRYRTIFHKKLDLKDPKTFNEKLQWLKLYDRKPEYGIMVDKQAVKDFVAEKIGAEHLIPTIGVWDRPEDIDFNSLPNQFVLKCNHDSGSVVICRDKALFDQQKAVEKLRRKMDNSVFWFGREWPYSRVKPCVIAETYMEDETQKQGLTDYKFYCFNGEPKFLYVSVGLEDHSSATISFLNLDWTLAPFHRMDFKPLKSPPPKPKNYEKMIAYAKKLSCGFPFLRVDMYEIQGKLYFSELTFTPSAGFTPFVPDEWDATIGAWLELPNK